MVLCGWSGMASAQSWCQPGATWYHGYWNPETGTVGYIRTEYTGDTLLGGSMAQKLEGWFYGYSSQSQEYNSYTTAPLYTTHADGLVRIWTAENEYDTLFNFNAGPGDSWQPHSFPPGSPQRMTVLDTGHALIAGASLKYLVMDLAYAAVPTPDTLYERLGLLNTSLDVLSVFYFDAGFATLRCYADEELSLTLGTTPCDLVTANEEHDVSPFFVRPFPNPGSGEFMLNYPPQQVEGIFEVRDLSGRLVLQDRLPRWGTMHRVSLPDARTGIYNCRLRWGTRTVNTRIIIMP